MFSAVPQPLARDVIVLHRKAVGVWEHALPGLSRIKRGVGLWILLLVRIKKTEQEVLKGHPVQRGCSLAMIPGVKTNGLPVFQ